MAVFIVLSVSVFGFSSASALVLLANSPAVWVPFLPPYCVITENFPPISFGRASPPRGSLPSAAAAASPFMPSTPVQQPQQHDDRS